MFVDNLFPCINEFPKWVRTLLLAGTTFHYVCSVLHHSGIDSGRLGRNHETARNSTTRTKLVIMAWIVRLSEHYLSPYCNISLPLSTMEHWALELHWSSNACLSASWCWNHPCICRSNCRSLASPLPSIFEREFGHWWMDHRTSYGEFLPNKVPQNY